MNIAAVAQNPAEFPRGQLLRMQPSALARAKAPAFGAEPAWMTLNYQGARAVRQRRKSWADVSANVAQMHCDGALYVDLGAGAARLSVVLEEVGGRIEFRAEDRRGQGPTGAAAERRAGGTARARQGRRRALHPPSRTSVRRRRARPHGG